MFIRNNKVFCIVLYCIVLYCITVFISITIEFALLLLLHVHGKRVKLLVYFELNQ